MENPIAISKLNDFIFCPVSIYFHELDIETEKMTYQSAYQLNGTAAHEAIDEKRYSTKKEIFQGIDIYCEKYNLYGKIDIFDNEKGILTERKKKISKIYDGYIYQLYGEYFSMVEMGFDVKEIRLYSMSDNKVFSIDLPINNRRYYDGFIKVINDINSFSFQNYVPSAISKCENCIYEELCSYSLLK